uniref:VM domain-containing protein n=1 Tax=Glossina austeni TaxID=7395 RepID=A0A1A9UJB1_GLOAU
MSLYEQELIYTSPYIGEPLVKFGEIWNLSTRLLSRKNLIKMQLNLLMIFGLIIQFHDLATVGAQLPCPNNYLFGCQAVLQPVPCEQGPPVAALPLTLPIPIQLLSSLTQAQPFPQLQSIYHHLLASLGHPTPICRSAKGLLHLQPSRSLSNKDSLDDEVNNKQ